MERRKKGRRRQCMTNKIGKENEDKNVEKRKEEEDIDKQRKYRRGEMLKGRDEIKAKYNGEETRKAKKTRIK